MKAKHCAPCLKKKKIPPPSCIRRKVRFREGSSLEQVREIDSSEQMDEKSRIWWSRRELYEARLDAYHTADLFVRGTIEFDEINNSIRGLEILVHGGETIEYLKFLHTKSVLGEAYRQTQKVGAYKADWEKVRQVSREYSVKFEHRAMALGIADQQEMLRLHRMASDPLSGPGNLARQANDCRFSRQAK
jgi:hypothetical protein